MSTFTEGAMRTLKLSGLLLLTIAAAGASGQEHTHQDDGFALRDSALMAPNVTYRWRGQYTSVHELMLDEQTGRPVPVAIEGEPRVTTFELVETLCKGEHHIVVSPREVAAPHRPYMA